MVCCQSNPPQDFWTPAKASHMRSILSKLMRCAKNCKACSRPWSTETAQFIPTTTQLHSVQPTLQKLNDLGHKVLPSTILTWPLTNQPPPLQAPWQLFARKMLLPPAGCRKCFPRVQWIPKHGFFTLFLWYKQTFLIGKCVDCNGSCFDQ